MQQTLESRIARLLSMSDETWERHANPWSVGRALRLSRSLSSRFGVGFGSGPWAWGMTALAIFWIWLNPRMFRKPVSTNNWASKAVLGERVWLNRKEILVPNHHRIVSNLLSGVTRKKGRGYGMVPPISVLDLSAPQFRT